MVLHVQPVTAPVEGVEAGVGFLLRVVEDRVGGRPGRGVVQDVRQQGVVQLGGVVPAEHEEDARADALGHLALVAEQAREAIDEQVAWKKLTDSQQSKNVLNNSKKVVPIILGSYSNDISSLSDPSQGTSHVSLTSDWSEKVGQPNPVEFSRAFKPHLSRISGL